MKKAAIAYLVLLVISSLAIGWIQPASLSSTEMDLVLTEPTWSAPFGYDSLGRNVFLRTLAGTKTSLGIGFLSATLAFAFALVVGSLAAEMGGRKDQTVMRAVEILQSVPSLVFSAVMILTLKAWLPTASTALILILALSLTQWMNLAKLTRNLLHQEKPQAYVEAARAIGASKARVLVRHLLPNIMPILLVLWGLQIPSSLLAEGVFTFLGFGLQPPETSWGLLIQEGWRMLGTNPHLMLGPSLVLTLTVLAINMLLRGSDRV